MDFFADVQRLERTPPNFADYVKLESDASGLDRLIVAFHPVNVTDLGSICIHLCDGYAKSYPNGGATVGGQSLAPGTLDSLLAQARDSVMSQLGLGLASGPFPRQWSTQPSDDNSHGILLYPTLDLHPDEAAPMHPQLIKDLASFRSLYGPTSVVVVEIPSLLQVEVSLLLPLTQLFPDITRAVCEAFNLDADEPLCLKFTVSRHGYLQGPHVGVQVGQAQRHFRTKNKRGVAAQLERILTVFCKDELEKERVPSNAITGEVLLVVAPNLCPGSEGEALPQLSEGAEPGRTTTEPKKSVPSRTSDGFLVQAARYVAHRMKTASEFCVICDQPHLITSGFLLRPSVCTRRQCVFSFQTFSVGADATHEMGTELGVVDLLWCTAMAAAKSDRWKLIFRPLPTVFDSTSQAAVLSGLEETFDIKTANNIFSAFPPLVTLAEQTSAEDLRRKLETAHALAYPLLQWIVQSNRCVIRKIPLENIIRFMGTPHQYYFLSSGPEQEAIFADLKAKHGAEWAFHGSRLENWHSILRNGLKNASGTKLQINGAAHGAGIYMSPHAAVSFGYSQIQKANSAGSEPSSVQESLFLDPSAMHCIAIIEVIKKDLKKVGQIWVQPHDTYVMTRFLFAYTRNFSFGASVILDDANCATLVEANEKMKY